MKTQGADKPGRRPNKINRSTIDAFNVAADKLSPTRNPTRNQRVLIGIALAAATFLAYARVLQNDFVYLDDRTYVTENVVVLGGLTWGGVKWAFTSIEASNWHPLTWLSHMLDVSLYGLNPHGHHLTNLLLHAVNVLLLFHLLLRMTGAMWPSAFVAGAFGLHSAHVESVAWIAERKDVLSTWLGLLTVIAYVRFTKRRAVSRYLIVVGLFVLALMAKPMMVTLPFLLLLLDYWPLRRTPFSPSSLREADNTALAPQRMGWRAIFLEKIPLVVLAAGSSIVTVYAQRAGGAMMTQQMLPFDQRVSNAIVSYAKYIWMTIWPAGLAVYYPLPLKPYPTGVVLAAASVLLAICVIVVVLRRQRPYLLVGWLWFLGLLVPVIGLVQVGGQALADRYTYLPIVGLFMMIAWTAREALHAPLSPLIKGGGAGVLLLLGVCTWTQAGYWRDSVTLFQRALDVVPDNTQAHLFMANTLLRSGKLDEAIPHFAEAVRIIPNEPFNMTDYGHALLDVGRIDEAAIQLQRALSLEPGFADAHFFLGVARLKQGQYSEAVLNLERALARNPVLTKAHLHLGEAHAGLKQWMAAITHLQKWLQIDPRSTEAMTQLAQCYYSLGNAVAAKETLQKAIDIEPNNPYPMAIKAQMEAWEGDVATAIALYDRALAMHPGYVEAANNLADILAVHPDEKFRDGARAVQLAELAAKARLMQDPVSLDTLAAAYSAVGRYTDAVRTVESAIALAQKAGSAAFVEHLQARRALYAASKPAWTAVH